ncbi:hypothetical protein PTSG_12068 [Salpingoeca rosetta]|uniref:Uncharacterized protein n=1 Tax=Salpingoeca rosetta (strain ATCC 50818 / BSB-021) TaxID=946362 RepID=F2U6G1_SALR5|nr:uncharacterized protein PTSG_12068 [Salpingoeca rosetta]EGD83102.1 hypothetical protein PTSG_12068 [Salpingoeca rosetta]|eukprot:XP_004995466.1 hypothetical protein PTSG_12068 [Salpingoeca rosetta]
MSRPSLIPATAGWFAALFGKTERGGYAAVKEAFHFDAVRQVLVAPNQEEFDVGVFSRPSVQELRDRVAQLPRRAKRNSTSSHRRRNVTVKHIATPDVMELHGEIECEKALFQAASQMNCLEMVSSGVTPEQGVTGYVYDRTQGPACALVSPAATMYRNYYVPVRLSDGQVQEGQTEEHQLNNLEDFEAVIGNDEHKYFDVINGYVMSTNQQLLRLKERLDGDADLCNQLISTIRIGLHEDVPVLLSARDSCNFRVEHEPHTVTQAYCSALSIAYNYAISHETWEPFESIVLQGMYEATILAGILNAARHNNEHGSKRVFLTLIGGGAYGNDTASIVRAAARAIALHQDFDIEVYVVHYLGVSESIRALLDDELEKQRATLYPNVVDL